jgi:hypothetical protein
MGLVKTLFAINEGALLMYSHLWMSHVVLSVLQEVRTAFSGSVARTLQ